MKGFRVEKGNGVVRVYIESSEASLADLPRSVLEELSKHNGVIVVIFPDRRVYVRPEEVRRILAEG